MEQKWEKNIVVLVWEFRGEAMNCFLREQLTDDIF